MATVSRAPRASMVKVGEPGCRGKYPWAASDLAQRQEDHDDRFCGVGCRLSALKLVVFVDSPNQVEGDRGRSCDSLEDETSFSPPGRFLGLAWRRGNGEQSLSRHGGLCA